MKIISGSAHADQRVPVITQVPRDDRLNVSGLKRGRHIQVGLMMADHRHADVPMDQVIANELEIIGSHGMQAHKYPEMLAMIRAGKLHPEKLVGRTIRNTR